MNPSTFKSSSNAVLNKMGEKFGPGLVRSFLDIASASIIEDEVTGDVSVAKESHEMISEAPTVEILNWGIYKCPSKWLEANSKEVIEWITGEADYNRVSIFDWASENDLDEAFETLLSAGFGVGDADVKWARQTIAVHVADIMLEKYQNFSAWEGI